MASRVLTTAVIDASAAIKPPLAREDVAPTMVTSSVRGTSAEPYPGLTMACIGSSVATRHFGVAPDLICRVHGVLLAVWSVGSNPGSSEIGFDASRDPWQLGRDRMHEGDVQVRRPALVPHTERLLLQVIQFAGLRTPEVERP